MDTELLLMNTNRYFINNDYFNQCLSLLDLKDIYDELCEDEQDFRQEYPTFCDYFCSCLDYNGGSLSEVNQNPRFQTEMGDALYQRIQQARTDGELALLYEMARDELDQYLGDDFMELDAQMEFRRYKLDRGMK